MKKLFWPLLSLLVLMFIFLIIIHSKAYYFQYADSLALGFYIIFGLWPVAIFCMLSSARVADKSFKTGKANIGVIAVIVFVFAIILGWPGFGMGIYEKCMTMRVGLLSTKTIVDSKDKVIEFFSERILTNGTRQNDLIAILNNEGDALSEQELRTVLHYLGRNKDPIVLKYAFKLAKIEIPKGSGYYGLPIRIIIDRVDIDNSKEFKELKDYAYKTMKDQSELKGFPRVIKYWQDEKKKYGHLI